MFAVIYRFKLKPHQEEIYQEYWKIGMVDKTSKNSIALVFTSPSCPKHTGVQIFHLKSDGSLYGE